MPSDYCSLVLRTSFDSNRSTHVLHLGPCLARGLVLSLFCSKSTTEYFLSCISMYCIVYKHSRYSQSIPVHQNPLYMESTCSAWRQSGPSRFSRRQDSVAPNYQYRTADSIVHTHSIIIPWSSREIYNLRTISKQGLADN
jgi:hypothetical protein